MGREVIQQVLLFAKEKRGGISLRFGNANLPEEFRSVGWSVLDEQLMIAKEGGLIKADRHSNGWHIQGLTLEGQDRLESPTSVEVLLEQNEILKQQVDVIRESSERAESVAREANKIARGANTRATCSMGVAILCAVISSLLLIPALVFWFSQVRL